MERTDFSIIRGDTVNRLLVLTDNVTGVPIDLSGGTMFFTAKALVGDVDASASIKKDWTTHTDPTDGKTYFSLTAVQTAALVPKDYEYDFQFKSSTGEIYTVARGIMTVEADITTRTTATA